MEDMVRKFWGMMVIAVLASTSLVSTTLVTPAFSARPPYQYGWWQKDPHGRWEWRGGWGPHGRWVRHGPHWVYRWR
jgi:hypothetical protein